MKLYYHKTDGGAEYYCLKPIAWGDSEGDLHYAILRTDGDEIELLIKNLLAYHIKVVEID